MNLPVLIIAHTLLLLLSLFFSEKGCGRNRRQDDTIQEKSERAANSGWQDGPESV